MMKNLLPLFIFFIMMGTTAKADNIPATQLFIDVIKPLETPVFELTPISGWGDIRFPASEQEADVDNIILEGAFSQGMILAKYSKKTLLMTFAELEYTKDSEKFDYNNKAELGLGIKLKHRVNKKFSFDVGVEYEWSYRPETERTIKDLTVFTNWFGRWSLGSSCSYPGYTWGGMSYSISYHEDLELSGAIIQGVDWYSFGKVIVNSFVRFAYTLEPEDHWIHSHITYGIGSQLKVPVTDDGAATHIGFLFNQNKMLESGRAENRISSFVSWYF